MAGFDPFEDTTDNTTPTTEEPTLEAPKKTTRKPRTTTTKKETTVSEPIVENTKTGISLTFKGGTSFDAPWLVGHLGSLEEAAVFLGLDPADYASPDELLKAVLKAAWGAAAYFHGQAPEKPAGGTNGGGGGNGGNGGGGARPARQQAPGNETRHCEHGEMVFKSGTTQSGPKAGETWKAFMCPAPKGANQCKPQWVK